LGELTLEGTASGVKLSQGQNYSIEITRCASAEQEAFLHSNALSIEKLCHTPPPYEAGWGQGKITWSAKSFLVVIIIPVPQYTF
jgi:hypothetical protein